jgi:hypothetical protein
MESSEFESHLNSILKQNSKEEVITGLDLLLRLIRPVSELKGG